MIAFFGKLWRNRRGNALAIAAACLPLFVGAAGLATDTIQWTLWKRQLQRAADSAAIAGVYDRVAKSGATTNTDATVTHDLGLNLHSYYALTDGNSFCSGKCEIGTPADTPFQKDQVRVTIAIQQRLAFSSMFMSSPPTITATSTAAAVPVGGDACFHATSKSSKDTGIAISGNAGIEAPDCVMYANPSSANSAYAKGSSYVEVEAVAAVGGIQQSNNWHVQAYRPYSPALDDPFAKIDPSPSDMNCATKTVVQGGKNVTTEIALDESTDLSALAGKNCFSGLSVSSSFKGTLDLTNFVSKLPGGTLYIDGGDADIQGNLKCTGCTIVLTNQDTSSTATIGQFKANASADINLTAPSASCDCKFKGIAIYQDRRAVDVSGKPNLINGNSGSQIVGALYFPNQELDYNGSGNTSAVCTKFVAYRLNFTGNSTTTNKFKSNKDCGYLGWPGDDTAVMVRLVG